MAAPVDDRLAGTALVVEPEFLVPQAGHEEGLSAEDLRERAAQIRRENGL